MTSASIIKLKINLEKSIVINAKLSQLELLAEFRMCLPQFSGFKANLKLPKIDSAPYHPKIW